MKSLWRASSRAELLTRFGHLSNDSQPRWGRMTVLEMLAHVNDSFRMASGELATEPHRGRFAWLLRLPPVNYLAACCLPFGHGLPTAPELIRREPNDFQSEIAQLRASVAGFQERSRAAPWAEHPFFGRLPNWAWGVLGYRHITHHLRQFGV